MASELIWKVVKKAAVCRCLRLNPAGRVKERPNNSLATEGSRKSGRKSISWLSPSLTFKPITKTPTGASADLLLMSSPSNESIMGVFSSRKAVIALFPYMYRSLATSAVTAAVDSVSMSETTSTSKISSPFAPPKVPPLLRQFLLQ